MNKFYPSLIMLVVMWMNLSTFASIFVANKEVCDKVYPITYILYTKLFCEIKDE